MNALAIHGCRSRYTMHIRTKMVGRSDKNSSEFSAFTTHRNLIYGDQFSVANAHLHTHSLKCTYTRALASNNGKNSEENRNKNEMMNMNRFVFRSTLWRAHNLTNERKRDCQKVFTVKVFFFFYSRSYHFCKCAMCTLDKWKVCLCMFVPKRVRLLLSTLSCKTIYFYFCLFLSAITTTTNETNKQTPNIVKPN